MFTAHLLAHWSILVVIIVICCYFNSDYYFQLNVSHHHQFFFCVFIFFSSCSLTFWPCSFDFVCKQWLGRSYQPHIYIWIHARITDCHTTDLTCWLLAVHFHVFECLHRFSLLRPKIVYGKVCVEEILDYMPQCQYIQLILDENNLSRQKCF